MFIHHWLPRDLWAMPVEDFAWALAMTRAGIASMIKG